MRMIIGMLRSSSLVEDCKWRSSKSEAANGRRVGLRPVIPVAAVSGVMLRISKDLAGGTVKADAESVDRLRLPEDRQCPLHGDGGLKPTVPE